MVYQLNNISLLVLGTYTIPHTRPRPSYQHPLPPPPSPLIHAQQLQEPTAVNPVPRICKHTYFAAICICTLGGPLRNYCNHELQKPAATAASVK